MENNLYVLNSREGPERYVFVGNLALLQLRIAWSDSPRYDFLRGSFETEIVLPVVDGPTNTPLLRLANQHFHDTIVNRLPARRPQPVGLFGTDGNLIAEYGSVRKLQAANPWLGQFHWTVSSLAWSAKTYNDRVVLWI